MRLLFALIHNNNLDRLSHIRPKIAELCQLLETRMDARSVEISWQPPISPDSALRALFCELWIDRLIVRDWPKYRLRPQVKRTRWLRNFSKAQLKKYYLRKEYYREALKAQRRTSAIQSIVSDKHIRALIHALDGDFDYLVVCEDDAVFDCNSIQKLSDLLPELPNGPFYFDLAGGVSREILDVDHLIDRNVTLNNIPFVRYSIPVTNTGCCYLIDRQMICRIIGLVLTKPLMRLLPFDWLLNVCFVAFKKDGLDTLCFHAVPPIVIHGSCAGNYKPWR